MASRTTTHHLPPYNPGDHFWRRADGRIYSSARQDYIGQDEPGYLAWLERGNHPTAFPKGPDGRESETELAAVLAHHGLALFTGEARFYLTRAGVYHRAGCRSTRAAGEWLDPGTLAAQSPDARPCGRCRPGPLQGEGDE